MNDSRDIYVRQCLGCRKRLPVKWMRECLGKHPYCEDCACELLRLVRTAGWEPRERKRALVMTEAPRDTQRERNKQKPDVMQARIPERKSGWVKH